MLEVLDDVGLAEEVLDDVTTLEVDGVATLDVDEDTDVVLVDVSVDRVVDVALAVLEAVVLEPDAEHAETAGSEPA